MDDNKCVICKDFFGNPDFNNMCSSCYKKNTPEDQLTPSMLQQKQEQLAKAINKGIQDINNQQRQDILDTWATNKFNPQRDEQIQELKQLITNHPQTRPQIAHEFMAKNHIFLTCEDAIELVALATGSWIAYHVFFSRCIDTYKVKEGIVELETLGGGAGYYAEFKRGQTSFNHVNKMSIEELEQLGDPKNLPEGLSQCFSHCDNCYGWNHGVQNHKQVDWTGYKSI